jgi:hypothetical protein
VGLLTAAADHLRTGDDHARPGAIPVCGHWLVGALRPIRPRSLDALGAVGPVAADFRLRPVVASRDRGCRTLDVRPVVSLGAGGVLRPFGALGSRGAFGSFRSLGTGGVLRPFRSLGARGLLRTCRRTAARRGGFARAIRVGPVVRALGSRSALGLLRVRGRLDVLGPRLSLQALYSLHSLSTLTGPCTRFRRLRRLGIR